MQTIKILKEGKILKDSNLEEKDNTKVVDGLSKYLGCFLEIEEGVTFEIFFNLILKEKEFFNIVFNQEMNEISLDEFEREFKKTAKTKQDDETLKNVKFIEISKFLSYEKYDEYDSLEVYNEVFAIHVEEGTNIENPLNINFVPVNELKKYPLIINNEIAIYKDYTEILLDGFTTITVGDAIKAILTQIAFYGNPKQRDKAKKETGYLMENEDMYEILKVKLEKAVIEENYELAEDIKKSIESLAKRLKK